jgi:hypothetical protein
MKKEDYCRTSEKEKDENKSKKVISDDAYALIDFIDQLINKIEGARLSLMK